MRPSSRFHDQVGQASDFPAMHTSVIFEKKQVLIRSGNAQLRNAIKALEQRRFLERARQTARECYIRAMMCNSGRRGTLLVMLAGCRATIFMLRNATFVDPQSCAVCVAIKLFIPSKQA